MTAASNIQNVVPIADVVRIAEMVSGKQATAAPSADRFDGPCCGCGRGLTTTPSVASLPQVVTLESSVPHTKPSSAPFRRTTVGESMLKFALMSLCFLLIYTTFRFIALSLSAEDTYTPDPSPSPIGGDGRVVYTVRSVLPDEMQYETNSSAPVSPTPNHAQIPAEGGDDGEQQRERDEPESPTLESPGAAAGL